MKFFSAYRQLRTLFNDVQRFVTVPTLDSELVSIGRSRTAEYIYQNMIDCRAVRTPFELHEIASQHVKLDGEILEFGVFSGTTIKHLCGLFPNNTVYGFDSFQGLPEDWRPGFPAGTFAIDNLPTVPENCDLVVGWFDKTLEPFRDNKISKRAISYLHIDCDLYSSTVTVLTILAQNIQVGTVIVFDEYFNYPGWEYGEYKAFQEWCKFHDRAYQYICYNATHEQVAVLITK